MSRGFFAKSLLVGEAPSPLVPRCGACGLYKTCQSPKMRPSGEGRRKILIVGEAPGADEDEQGKQFVGKAGQRLTEELDECGVDFRKDCWVTNALICHPPRNKIDNPIKIDYCRPNLTRTVRELQPEVIVLLGGHAVRSLIGEIWRENPGPIGRWVGWNIPSQALNAWVCPTWHPAYLERMNDMMTDYFFKRHLAAAVAHENRPWREVPDWESQVEVIMDTERAAAILYEFEQIGGVHALDFENTALKPETEGAEIVCVSVCHQGKRTISTPWCRSVKAAVTRLVQSERCEFVASNLKHENRWVIHETGRPVRHWLGDTMIAAHVLDNRRHITGLKFQAFVNLGMPSYNDKIEEFLRALKGQQTNRAKTEVDLRQLLQYCAVDSLLEFKLLAKQFRQLADLQDNMLSSHEDHTDDARGV